MQDNSTILNTTKGYKAFYVLVCVAFIYMGVVIFKPPTFQQNINNDNNAVSQLDHLLTPEVSQRFDTVSKQVSLTDNSGNSYIKQLSVSNMLLSFILIAAGLSFILKIHYTRILIEKDIVYIYRGLYSGVFKKPLIINPKETEKITIYVVNKHLNSKVTTENVTWREKLVIDDDHELSGTVYSNLNEFIKIYKHINPDINIELYVNTIKDNIKRI